MATTGATLVSQARRLLRDQPEDDVLTASLASGGTALTVADGTIYSAREYVEIDQEVLRATAVGTGTTVPVRRAIRGSTAVSHASGATVLMNPRFFSVEILDEINNAIDACFPRLYRPVSLDYTGLLTDTYEYTIPTVNGEPLPFISSIEVKEPGALSFMPRREFKVVRDSISPYLEFRSALTAAGTIRINGFGSFARLTSVADTLDSFFPRYAISLLPLYAAGALLDSAEVARVRMDSGAMDNREQATGVTASSKQASKLQQRFYTQLERWAMPPPAKSIRVTG